MNVLLDLWTALERRILDLRTRRKWSQLQALGMRMGRDVVLPRSTWIDVSHCFLITIGDRVRFGPQCLILAHDAQMDEFLDAGRIGRVVIGDDCRIGPRTVILCNVEIGAGTIVEAGAVVATSLPPRSYCAGAPARVVSSAEDYARKVMGEVGDGRRYSAKALRQRLRAPSSRRTLIEELTRGPVLVETMALATPPAQDDQELSE